MDTTDWRDDFMPNERKACVEKCRPKEIPFCFTLIIWRPFVWCFSCCELKMLPSNCHCSYIINLNVKCLLLVKEL